MHNQYNEKLGMGSNRANMTPNRSRKTPVRFARQVSNGVGAGLMVMLISSLQLSLDINWLSVQHPKMFDNYSSMKLIESAAYIVSFMLAYYVIKVVVDIPGSVALPWGKVDTEFSILAVCLGLGCSFVGALLTNVFNTLLGSATGYEPTMPDIDVPQSALGWVLHLVAIAVLPAIMEEIVFRGAVLQSLRQFGDRFAILASAFLFAIGHGNLVQGPNSFMMGVLLGCMAVYTGSIKVSILVHFCNNFLFSLIAAANELSGGLPDIAYTIFFAGIIAMGAYGFMSVSRLSPGIYPRKGTGELSSGASGLIGLVSSPMAALYVLICGAMVALYFTPVG